MKHRLLIFTIVISGLFSGIQAQQPNETSISVQIRPRAEYRNGALNPRNETDLPASFINNRARLSFDYKRNNLMTRISAQYLNVWGQDPQSDMAGRVNLNEAWAKMIFGKSFFVQLGRQILIYDDERILGGLDWHIAGRSHDALKFGYENSIHSIHGILAYNQNGMKVIGGDFYIPNGQPYKSMQTLWYQYRRENMPFKVSALIMNLGFESSTEEKPQSKFMQTVGANASYGISGFNFAGTFYYQTGKTVANTDISAFMASLNIGYNINSKWNVGIGSDYLSGNKEGENKHTAFNPLYGTHHKFYGTMDYFYASAFQDGINPGLWDNFARISFKPIEKLNLSLNYHNFMLAQDVTTAGEKLSKGLGSEVDFQLDWTIMKDVKLSGGYSFMLGTKSMDIVKGGEHNAWQDWGWISLNINPRIFFAKW